ncbi:MAG: DUF3568 family protein [Desulfobacteraceae bacterium]|jgi:hypothetical protein
MKKNRTHFLKVFIIGLSLLAFTGCVEWLTAAGTGAFVTAEYVLTGEVTKTISYGFGRIKKALLVALCKMEIKAETAREIEDGEEIFAKANELEIRIELKEITPKVTRVSVKAEKGFLNRDKATAQEIVHQTHQIAERLVS